MTDETALNTFAARVAHKGIGRIENGEIYHPVERKTCTGWSWSRSGAAHLRNLRPASASWLLSVLAEVRLCAAIRLIAPACETSLLIAAIYIARPRSLHVWPRRTGAASGTPGRSRSCQPWVPLLTWLGLTFCN
jgi:hypothetical protein